jgi:hypothetical protein
MDENNISAPPSPPAQPPQLHKPSFVHKNIWLLLLGAGILSVTFLGLGIWWFTNYTKSVIKDMELVSETLVESTESTETPKATDSAFGDIVDKPSEPFYGTGTHCKVEDPTFGIAGEKVVEYYEYEDFALTEVTLVQENASMVAKTLATDTDYYIWSTGETTAFEDYVLTLAAKFSREEASTFGLVKNPFKTDFADTPEACKDWKVEPEKLQPPTDIEFDTYSGLVSKLAGESVEEISEKPTQKQEDFEILCTSCRDAYGDINDQITCFAEMMDINDEDAEDAYKSTCHDFL